MHLCFTFLFTDIESNLSNTPLPKWS